MYKKTHEFSIYNILYATYVYNGNIVLDQIYLAPTSKEVYMSLKPFRKYNGNFLENYRMHVSIESDYYALTDTSEYVNFSFSHRYYKDNDKSEEPLKYHFEIDLELDKILKIVDSLFREEIIGIDSVVSIIKEIRDILKDYKHKYPFINLNKRQIIESWKLVNEYIENRLLPSLNDTDKLYIELITGKL